MQNIMAKQCGQNNMDVKTMWQNNAKHYVKTIKNNMAKTIWQINMAKTMQNIMVKQLGQTMQNNIAITMWEINRAKQYGQICMAKLYGRTLTTL